MEINEREETIAPRIMGTAHMQGSHLIPSHPTPVLHALAPNPKLPDHQQRIPHKSNAHSTSSHNSGKPRVLKLTTCRTTCKCYCSGMPLAQHVPHQQPRASGGHYCRNWDAAR